MPYAHGAICMMTKLKQFNLEVCTIPLGMLSSRSLTTSILSNPGITNGQICAHLSSPYSNQYSTQLVFLITLCSTDILHTTFLIIFSPTFSFLVSLLLPFSLNVGMSQGSVLDSPPPILPTCHLLAFYCYLHRQVTPKFIFITLAIQ